MKEPEVKPVTLFAGIGALTCGLIGFAVCRIIATIIGVRPDFGHYPVFVLVGMFLGLVIGSVVGRQWPEIKDVLDTRKEPKDYDEIVTCRREGISRIQVLLSTLVDQVHSARQARAIGIG